MNGSPILRYSNAYDLRVYFGSICAPRAFVIYRYRMEIRADGDGSAAYCCDFFYHNVAAVRTVEYADLGYCRAERGAHI